MQECFWIESRGYRMLSILEYDDLSTKGENMVVLIHGFGGTKIEPHRMYPKLSNRLSKLGFTVLRFDFVGSGDSDGDFKDMTISGEIQDSVNVVNYCRDNFFAENIFILGYSMGGCIASYTASLIENNGLVLWSPVSNLYWNFYHIFGKERFKRGLEGNDVDYLGDVLGSRFFDELLNINPLERIKSYKKPVCIIHGTEDKDVLPFNSNCYNKKILNCNIHFINGADHCYSSREWEEELLTKTTEFLSSLI